MSEPTSLMPYLASLVCGLFILLAFLHVYWAIGGRWGSDKVIPRVDDQPLFTPGPAITLLVALGLFGIAILTYILGFYGGGSLFGNYIIYVAWLLVFIFSLRAIGDFKLIGFFKKNNDSVFAKYDSRYYSPLCLALAFIFGLLAINAV